MKAFDAHRRAGRGDPQHAAALAAQAGGDRDHAASTRRCRRSEGDSRRCWRDEKRRWKAIAGEMEEMRKKFGGGAARQAPHRARRGARRSSRCAGGLIEREPITVHPARTRAGSARCKGQVADAGELKYKEGDRLRLLVRCRDHRPALPVRHQRPRLHAQAADTAARPRRRRAGAPAGRYDQRGRRRRRCCVTRRGQTLLSRPAPGAASSCRRTRCWPRSAPASRC